MIDPFAGGLFSELFSNLQHKVRKEADYISVTIGDGICKGFEDGFELFSMGFFKLMVSTFSVVFGILFVSYGFAVFLGNYLDMEGVGFLVVGIIALLIGAIAFISMKKR